MKTDKTLKDENPDLYKVAREGRTELPFTGKYADETAGGIYKCAVCGHELFHSESKLDSKKSSIGLQGWPSFSEPSNMANITLKEDLGMGMNRTEVLCKNCGAHLGHLFKNQTEADGKVCDHYCVNSVSLDLEKE